MTAYIRLIVVTLLMLVTASVAKADDRATLFVNDVTIQSALLKEHLPVAIIQNEEHATFILKTVDSPRHDVVSVQLVKGEEIVWTYETKDTKHTAETIAKHLKSEYFKETVQQRLERLTTMCRTVETCSAPPEHNGVIRVR